MEEFCKHSNEPTDFANGGEMHGHLIGFSLLKLTFFFLCAVSLINFTFQQLQLGTISVRSNHHSIKIKCDFLSVMVNTLYYYMNHVCPLAPTHIHTNI